ncbi:MAG: hypothetical protein ACKVTZ_15825, partial [Bacteroidia bacterium]
KVLRQKVLEKVEVESASLKAAIAQSSEEELKKMELVLKEIEGAKADLQHQLWDEFAALGMKNNAIKVAVDNIEAESKAAGEAANSAVKLKIGVPEIVKFFLGIGVEYEATLVDGSQLKEWTKALNQKVTFL